MSIFWYQSVREQPLFFRPLKAYLAFHLKRHTYSESVTYVNQHHQGRDPKFMKTQVPLPILPPKLEMIK